MKKIISALLSICMTISVLAIGTAVSAEGETEATATNATEVWYSGVKLDAASPYLLRGKATGASTTTLTASSTEEGTDGTWTLLAQFDASKGALSFKYPAKGSNDDITKNNYAVGFPLKKIDTNSDGSLEDEKYYGIYAKGSLAIDLGNYVNLLYLGDNVTAGAGRNKPADAAQEGIHVEGDLTVNGSSNGLLRVTANPPGKSNGNLQSYGIYATGTVTLNGGTLDAYDTVWEGNGYSISNNKTTYIKASDVKLNGGTLLLRGRKNGSGTPRKLHEIGSDGKDYITVPDSYVQKWASQLELTSGSDTPDNWDKDKGNDINTTFSPNKTEGDLYVKYTPIEKGFKIKVMGQELGGDKKYLHIGENNAVTVSADPTDASAEYNITKNEGGTLTKELKFLKDATLSYNAEGVVYIIESDSDLVINTNQKIVKLYSAMNYQWPYTRTSCIRAEKDLTIMGGGSLIGRIEGEAAEDKESASDRSASAVIYSGGKLTLDDVNATLFIAKERNNATSVKYPQSNVIYASEVVIGQDASLKLRKRLAPTDNDAAGYLIGGAASNKVSVSKAADSFIGSIEIDNANAYDWTGALKASDKLYDYTYDGMKTATYMEVSTADKTVSIDSIKINDKTGTEAEVNKTGTNTVKFTLSNADTSEGATAPNVIVIAAIRDASGALSSVRSYAGNADGDEHLLELDGGSSITLYIWDKTDSLKPLKKTRTYYAAESTDQTVTE